MRERESECGYSGNKVTNFGVSSNFTCVVNSSLSFHLLVYDITQQRFMKPSLQHHKYFNVIFLFLAFTLSGVNIISYLQPAKTKELNMRKNEQQQTQTTSSLFYSLSILNTQVQTHRMISILELELTFVRLETGSLHSKHFFTIIPHCSQQTA